MSIQERTTPGGAGDGEGADAPGRAERRALTRHDVRDEPGRCIRLAVENGLETWMDFETGRMDTVLPHRDELAATTDVERTETPSRAPSMTEPRATAECLPDPLLPIVTAALDERGWRYERVSPQAVYARVRHTCGTYDVHVTVDDRLRLVCCYCVMPACVPEKRRREMAALLNRINWESIVGCMEMDVSDGEVRFRSIVDVEDGRLSTTMVNQMLSAGHHAFDRHYVAVMRVAFGDVDAETAMSELGEP